MGDWKTSTGNIIRAQSLLSQSPNPRDFEDTQNWHVTGRLKDDVGVNSEESFSGRLESYVVNIKKQMNPYRVIYPNSGANPERWAEHKDIYLFAKTKGTDLFDYVQVNASGSFSTGNKLFVNLYSCDPHNHEPVIWDEKTIATTGLSIADDTSDGSNHKTKFSITDSAILDINDFDNYNLITISGNSTVPDGTYAMSGVVRTTNTNMDFNLSTDVQNPTTTYLDVRSGGSTLTGQSATLNFTRSLKVYSIDGGGIDTALADGIPTHDERGIYQPWYMMGRSMWQLCKGRYYYHSIPSTTTTRGRSAPRLPAKEEYFYWGIEFRRPPRFDGGVDYAHIGATLSYGVYE